MKIDVTKIEGFEAMTPEEQVEALKSYEYEIPEPDYTGYIKKEQFDKTSSELAEMKRRLDAQLSEEERQQLAHSQELEELRKTVATMEAEKTIAEIKANYISMGYEEELADDTARATLEGDNKRIFQNHKKFLEAHDKAFEASLLAKTPRPDGAGASGTKAPMTKAEIIAIKDDDERREKIKENIALFERS